MFWLGVFAALAPSVLIGATLLGAAWIRDRRYRHRALRELLRDARSGINR